MAETKALSELLEREFCMHLCKKAVSSLLSM